MFAEFLGIIVCFFTDRSSKLGLVPGNNRRFFRTFFGLTLNASLSQLPKELTSAQETLSRTETDGENDAEVC